MTDEVETKEMDIVPATRRIRVSNVLSDGQIVLTVGSADGIRYSDRFLRAEDNFV